MNGPEKLECLSPAGIFSLVKYFLCKASSLQQKGAPFGDSPTFYKNLWRKTLSYMAYFKNYSCIRKEFFSRINWMYYWRLFCTTHEHHNHLQLKQSLI
jgi:hypothetical protein